MATNDCSPVKYIYMSKTAFYFEVTGTDAGIEEDNFEKSDCKILQHLIGNNDDKFLILNTDEEFQVQSLTKKEKEKSDNKFNIQFYKDNDLNGKTRRAVILYVNRGDKKMVACCNDNGEICPEAMDLPQEIGESKHKAVFYKTELSSSNKNLLESSLYPTKFMGFKSIERDPNLSKLVLVCKGADELDESCHICFI